MSEVIEGLLIFKKYHKHNHWIGAEHDVLYVYSTSVPIEKEDVEKLLALGWFQEDAEYDLDIGQKVENYNPEESWCHYT